MKKKEDFLKFINLLEDINNVYNNCNFGEKDDKKVLLYWENLKQFKINAVERGIKLMIKRRVFTNCPPPAEIIQYIEMANI